MMVDKEEGYLQTTKAGELEILLSTPEQRGRSEADKITLILSRVRLDKINYTQE